MGQPPPAPPPGHYPPPSAPPSPPQPAGFPSGPGRPPMPPAYQYYYSPVRRRTGGAGAGVVVALGFVAFIFVCGIVAAKAMSTGGATSSPGASGSRGAPTAAGPGTGSDQGEPGGGRSSGTTSGGGSAGAAQPAAADRLYRIGPLAGYRCRGRVIAPSVPSSFAAFLNTTTDCLDRTWSTALHRAGVPFRPPIRVFWTRPGRSPCGDYPAPGAAAFYCPLNDGMYIGVTHAQEAAAGLPVRYNVAYARAVAHEYGHHVQDQVGILDYSHEARTRAATLGERNAISRRNELQAQCLAGTFMAAVRPSFPVTSTQWRVALRDSYGRGDDPADPDYRDHGSRRHYASWLNHAFVRRSTSVCDTWSAPGSRVT